MSSIGYVDSAQSGTNVRLYALYNPATTRHFYAIDTAEVNYLVSSQGWQIA